MYDFNANNMISELEGRDIEYFYVEYEEMPNKIIYIKASDGVVLTAVVVGGTFESIMKINNASIYDMLNKIVYQSIYPLHGMDRISVVYSRLKPENASEGALVDKSCDEHIVPSDEEYLDDEDDGEDYGNVYIVYGSEDEPDPDDEIEAD